MAQQNVPILSLNAGEVSPLVDARSDVEKYASGCRILENMLPRIYGPVTRRPGTKYISTVSDTSVVGRLIDFEYSNAIAYIIELGDLSARFYFDGGVLQSGGADVTVTTPYLAAELFEIQYKQSNDVMWLLHSSHAQRKLSRVSATEFSLDTIEFTNGPFLPRHDLDVGDGIYLTSTVTAKDDTGTLTASGPMSPVEVFQAGHVGALFRLTLARSHTVVKDTQSSVGVVGDDPPNRHIDVEGTFSFTTSGNWDGTILLQRNENEAGWETFRSYTSYITSGKGSRNVQYAGNEKEDNVQYRMNMTEYNAGTCNAEFNVHASTQDGIVRVTGYTSSSQVTIKVIKKLPSINDTIRWSEGCWSDVRGYPTTMTFFEERVIYAGTTFQPQAIWFSKSGFFDYFKEGVNDNDSFSVTINSDERNAIRWITSLDSLVLGTAAGEWRIRSTTFDEAITPTNFSVKLQTNRGSTSIQAIPVNDAILFVDFVARKIREMTYSGANQKLNALDLTSLAEHITKTGITQIALQRNPDVIVWMTLNDGTLVSMTYERDQNVVAFARHIIGGVDGVKSQTFPELNPTDYPLLFGTDDQAAVSPTQTTAIHNVTELQAMNGDTAGNYYLANDIDASATVDWNAGEGFIPIGTAGDKFDGTFDGNGYTISDLYINRNASQQSLFGQVQADSSQVVIANVTLADVDITGDGQTAALASNIGVSATDNTLIQNCHSTGAIKAWPGVGATTNMGGLVAAPTGTSGQNVYIYDSDSTCTVNVNTSTIPQGYGGFVGNTNHTTIKNCFATGDVDGGTGNNIGGFAGSISLTSTISYCYATGDVIGNLRVGGFVGAHGNTVGAGSIQKCYARGNVTATTVGAAYAFDNGGFAGNNTGDIINCYAWGNVTATGDNSGASGFIGNDNASTQTITNCYSIGIPTGDGGSLMANPIYGFAHNRGGGGIYTSSYWDTGTSGVSSSLEGVGHDTVKMKTQAEYTNWDFDDIWYMGTSTTVAVTLDDNIAESVAVIPGATEDEVWITVKRAINRVNTRFVEQMQPRDFGGQEDMFFVDSGLTYDGVATATLTGLDHLEGEEVVILADGAVFPNDTVSNGSITLSESITKAHVGLPYSYKVKPMRLDLNIRGGTTKGSIKKIAEIVISFFETMNAEYGDGVDTFPINWREGDDLLGSPPGLYTGDKLVTLDGGFSVEDPIVISGSGPCACTIRAIIPRIDKTGR